MQRIKMYGIVVCVASVLFFRGESFGQALSQTSTQKNTTDPASCPYKREILELKLEKQRPPQKPVTTPPKPPKKQTTKYDMWELEVGIAQVTTPVYTKKGFTVALADQRILTFDAYGQVLWNHTYQGDLLLGFSHDAALYYGDSQGNILALNLDNGQAQWTKSGFGAFQKASRFHMTKELLIFIQNNTDLTAISKNDGREVWRQKLPEPLSHQPTGDEKYVFTASKNTLYQLEIRTGKLLAQKAQPITIQPVFYKDLLFIPGQTTLIAMRASDTLSKLAWTSNLQVAQPLQFYDNFLYTVDTNADLVKLDIQKGEILWKHKVVKESFITGYLEQDVVLVARLGDTMFRFFDTRYGNPIKNLTAENSDANILMPVLRAQDDYIYYVTASWKLYKAKVTLDD